MIISMVNQKGGVSKTTSTFNLCHALAMKGKKVLAVDLDPQSSLTISFGIEPENLELTLYDVLCEDADIKKVILDQGNIHLVPSIIDLSVAEMRLVSELGREAILKNKLSTIIDYYDYIIIDCPPSLSLLTINALCASDRLLIPVTTEYLALRGMSLLFDTIDKVKNLNPNLKVLGVIPTMHDTRTLHAKEVLEKIKKDCKDIRVFEPISKSVKVQDSILDATSIIATDPEHKISQAYKRIADEVVTYE